MKIFALMLLTVLSIVPSAMSEPLKIGALLGLSGPIAGFSSEIRDGLLLANEDLKRSGNDGFKIIFEDSKYDPKLSVAGLQKLIDFDSVRIVFVSSTIPVMAVKPLSESRDILVLALAGHAGFLDGSRTMINFSNNSDSDGEIMARAVEEQRPRKVVELYLQNDWGESYHKAFCSSFAKLSSAPLTWESHLPGETDFHTMLAKVLRQEPDLIVLNSIGASLGHLIRQLRELQFSGKIYANQGLVLSREAAGAIEGLPISNLYYQTYDDPPREFIEHYRQRFGADPAIFGLVGYSYLELLHDAVRAVGVDPVALSRSIKSKKHFKGRFMEIEIGLEGNILVRTLLKKWQ